jgi:hypothetical protein
MNKKAVVLLVWHLSKLNKTWQNIIKLVPISFLTVIVGIGTILKTHASDRCQSTLANPKSPRAFIINELAELVFSSGNLSNQPLPWHRISTDGLIRDTSSN